jgi:signal transduction histidine kinase
MRLNRQLRHEIGERMKAEADLRHAKDAAEEADRAKGRYLAFMAHEVRTPRGGIIGLAELIGSEPLSPEQKKHLHLVESSGQSLLKLISDTLDFSKLDTDHLDLEIEPVDLQELVGEICELFSASARHKNLALRHEIDSAIPGKVKTDPYRLRQVLTNLISNALKFTQQGGVTVLVESHSVIASSRKRSLQFRVCDTGQGISAEEIARLFKPYSQANAAVARQHGGTGLGLSIAQRLTRLLGGDIRVESTPGKGSTFTVEIVVEDVA